MKASIDKSSTKNLLIPAGKVKCAVHCKLGNDKQVAKTVREVTLGNLIMYYFLTIFSRLKGNNQ